MSEQAAEIDHIKIGQKWRSIDGQQAVASLAAAHRAQVRDALENLSDEEADAVDWYMNEHMYHHRHVAQVYAMGCDVRCRTQALAEAFRRHVLLPRREARDSAIRPEQTTETRPR